MVKKYKIKCLFVLLLLLMILFSGCAQSIAEIKSNANIDKEVKTKGEVVESIKLGGISGYMIKDSNNDTIYVSSKELPKEDTQVIVKGILRKKVLIGYYIESVE